MAKELCLETWNNVKATSLTMIYISPPIMPCGPVQPTACAHILLYKRVKDNYPHKKKNLAGGGGVCVAQWLSVDS